MNKWDLYAARLNMPGSTARERIISRNQENLVRKQMTLASRKEVEISGVSRVLFIHSTDIPSEKTFNTLPGEIVNIGDVLYWENMHWLVTQIDFDDEVTRNGRIVQCNRQIRWQNKNTGEIITRWCLAKKPYSTNVADGIAIGTSTREYKIQLSCDDETMRVDLDRRFLLESIDGVPRAYKLVSVDTITNRYEDIAGGFLIWNMEQTEYNPLVDNAELMIANYFEPNDGVAQANETEKLSCYIEGRETIREGFSRTYTAHFYDIDGVDMDTTVEAIWSVQAPTDAVTLTQDGHKAVLTYHSGMQPGERIQISVRDKYGNYATSTFYVEVIEFL